MTILGELVEKLEHVVEEIHKATAKARENRYMGSLYEDAKGAGLEMDSHASDLYLRDCPAARALIKKHNLSASVFTHAQKKERWLDVPFAYLPWWEARRAHAKNFTATTSAEAVPACRPHNVPKVGTLREISYCKDCGAGFDDKGPCPGVRQ